MELVDQADSGFSNALALLCNSHFTIEEMKPRDLFAGGGNGDKKAVRASEAVKCPMCQLQDAWLDNRLDP